MFYVSVSLLPYDYHIGNNTLKGCISRFFVSLQNLEMCPAVKGATVTRLSLGWVRSTSVSHFWVLLLLFCWFKTAKIPPTYHRNVSKCITVSTKINRSTIFNIDLKKSLFFFFENIEYWSNTGNVSLPLQD